LANAQSNQIVRTVGAWFAISSPHHKVEVFMSVTLIPVECEARFFLTAVAEKLKGFADWQWLNRRG
jgi:hypothetical protein